MGSCMSASATEARWRAVDAVHATSPMESPQPESFAHRAARVRIEVAAKQKKVLEDNLVRLTALGDLMIRSFKSQFDEALGECLVAKKDPRECKFSMWLWAVNNDAVHPEENLEMFDHYCWTDSLDQTVTEVSCWNLFVTSNEAAIVAYREQVFQKLAAIVPGTYRVRDHRVGIHPTFD